MLSVAKSRSNADQPAVEANTPDWRTKVNAELDQRPRGTRTKLADHLGISTGHLSEMLGEPTGEPPDQVRFTRYRRQIDEWLWPPLLPLSADTLEIQHIVEGVDRDLLRVLKDMPRDQQRKWAELIISTRKQK